MIKLLPNSSARDAVSLRPASIATSSRAFEFDEIVESERKNLLWIPRSRNVAIRGLKIPGGVYVGTPQFFSFSFAIDPGLTLGTAEKAEPLTWSRYPVDYSRLTDNQRAFYIRWLRGETTHIRQVNATPYAERYLSGLEWHLLVDRDDDDSVCELVCDLAERDTMAFASNALALLNWWGQLQGPREQIIVTEEAIAFGFNWVPSASLALTVANLASLSRELPVAIAGEIAIHRCPQKPKISLRDLRLRVRERLTAIHSEGLSLPKNESTPLKVMYSPICPELKNERLLATGDPIPRVEVPNFLNNQDLVGRIDRLVSSIFSGPIINSVVRVQVATETAHVKSFLADRTSFEPEELPPIPPVAERTKPELTESHRLALQKLLGSTVWNEASYSKVAEEFRLRPSGLRSILNRWSQETWGDLLLEGTDPIQLNPYVVKQIQRTYE